MTDPTPLPAVPPEPKPKKKRQKPRQTQVRDMGVQRAQGTLMLAKRIIGQSLNSIADEFNVSKQVIGKRIELAKRENLLSSATDKVLEELVCLAHDAYKKALVDGDIEAARDIMYGTGILSKNSKAQMAPDGGEMTLAIWRESRANGFDKPAPPALEGEVTEVTDEQIL